MMLCAIGSGPSASFAPAAIAALGSQITSQVGTSHQAPSAILVFLLVFARVTGALTATPIYAERALPGQVKVGLSAMIAFLLTPAQIATAGSLPGDPIAIALLFAQQVLLGLAFALVFVVVYHAAEMGGSLIGQQLGVTLGTFGRAGGDQMSTISAIYNTMAGLLFLGLDAHHWVILGLGASFDALPVTQLPTLTPGLAAVLFPLGGAALQFALGMALPILVVLLLADLATGLLGRAIPALNMFVLGLPVKVLLGTIGILIALPYTIQVFIHLVQTLPDLRIWS